MGYDVHLTRAEEWTASESRPIGLEEWCDYVRGDPEMHLVAAEATTPEGDTLRLEEPGLAAWTAWSRHGRDGGMAWFSWYGGRVTVKNPDPEILGKMVSIARRLDATVQGDDGETYDQPPPGGGAVPASGDAGSAGPGEPPRRAWWRRLFS